VKTRKQSQSEETNVSSEPLSTPFLTPLVMGMDVLGALIVLGMMIIVNIDVFGRWLFNSPLAGTFELTEMGIVAVVYLQLAHTIKVKRLTRSDAFLNLLANKVNLNISYVLRLIFNLTGASVMAIIAYGELPRLIDAWNRDYYKGNVGIFTAPTWPLETIILVGVVAASLQFLILAYLNFLKIRSKS